MDESQKSKLVPGLCRIRHTFLVISWSISVVLYSDCWDSFPPQDSQVSLRFWIPSTAMLKTCPTYKSKVFMIIRLLSSFDVLSICVYRPLLQFITWTSSDLLACDLCPIPPHAAIEVNSVDVLAIYIGVCSRLHVAFDLTQILSSSFPQIARVLGLPTVNYEVIAVSEVDRRMEQVCMLNISHTFMQAVKTAQYFFMSAGCYEINLSLVKGFISVWLTACFSHQWEIKESFTFPTDSKVIQLRGWGSVLPH